MTFDLPTSPSRIMSIFIRRLNSSFSIGPSYSKPKARILWDWFYFNSMIANPCGGRVRVNLPFSRVRFS